eukprot:TRINITY_DN3760_c0_g1_i1.p1 TRINITY_DN3760_c0_g1~~TRINITY_DN3760_c0_g1_i1.p1  ORF type:complete len:540 (+),score=166.41 TRINITY_DN3760_c0_g1_i1:41-1660(+)
MFRLLALGRPVAAAAASSSRLRWFSARHLSSASPPPPAPTDDDDENDDEAENVRLFTDSDDVSEADADLLLDRNSFLPRHLKEVEMIRGDKDSLPIPDSDSGEDSLDDDRVSRGSFDRRRRDELSDDEVNVFDLLNPTNIFPGSSDEDDDIFNDDDDLDFKEARETLLETVAKVDGRAPRGARVASKRASGTNGGSGGGSFGGNGGGGGGSDDDAFYFDEKALFAKLSAKEDDDERLWVENDAAANMRITEEPENYQTPDRQLHDLNESEKAMLKKTGFMDPDPFFEEVVELEDFERKVILNAQSGQFTMDLFAEMEAGVVEASSKAPSKSELKTPDSRGLEGFKLLLKRDEELAEIDKEYKRIVLGGVKKEDPESVFLVGGQPYHDHTTNKRHPHIRPPLPLSTRLRVNDRGIASGVGRRKAASARVFIKPGTGLVTINRRDHIDYFSTERARVEGLAALLFTQKMGQYDVTAFVSGGGQTGQFGAFKRGLAYALMKAEPETRPILVRSNLLKPDPRKVERKKFGQRKARKKFAFVKR